MSRNIRVFAIFCVMSLSLNSVVVGLCLPMHEKFQRSPFYDLGIELQEVSGLCPWARKNRLVQKRPIFKVNAYGIFAWRVEVDGNDIEFVTEPFSHNQRNVFQKCICDIQIAVGCLREIKAPKFSFGDWIDLLRKEQMDIFYTDNDLANNDICVPQVGWKPVFAPQVTVKHPLEWTMPLYVAMVMSMPKQIKGDVINKCESFNEVLLRSTLPFLKHLKVRNTSENAELLFNLYHNKLLGLMFINALTMEAIGSSDQSDDEAIKGIFDSCQLYGQFDAKMRLMLMSRRPFSQMYFDIDGDQALVALIEMASPLCVEESLAANSSYVDVFRAIMMSDDNDYKDSIELFYRAAYGEQYYEENGSPVDLSSLKSELSEDLRVGRDLPVQLAYREKLISCTPNMIYIEGLLRDGIITTTMLRDLSSRISYLQKYFAKGYYEDVLESISNPALHDKRVIITTKDKQVGFDEVSYCYDLLSPPVFLDEKSDSMGYCKENYLDFREALIEVRMIQDIGDFFISYFMKLNVEKTKGYFLKNGGDLSKHALALLDGLHNFENEILSSEGKKKIMGMLYVFANKK